MNALSAAVEPESCLPDRPRSVRILVLERDSRLRSRLVADLRSAGWDVLPAATVRAAARMGSSEPVDLLVMSPRAARGEGLFLWSRLSRLQAHMPIILPVSSREVAHDPAARSELLTKVRSAVSSPIWFSHGATR